METRAYLFPHDIKVPAEERPIKVFADYCKTHGFWSRFLYMEKEILLTHICTHQNKNGRVSMYQCVEVSLEMDEQVYESLDGFAKELGAEFVMIKDDGQVKHEWVW